MGDYQNKELIYDRKLIEDLEKLDVENKKVLEWIKKGDRVLEFGCHSGYLSYWLKRYDCLVTGVDLDTEALKKAAPYLDNSFVGNIEKDDFWNYLGDSKYDSITFMHILEHLIDPWKVLERTKGILEDDGTVIISIPNICNARNRFSILKGRFDYEDTGVMDRTHLRFFNKKTGIEMIEKSGFKVVEYFAPVQVNPIKCLLDELPVFHHIGKHMVNKRREKSIFSNNLTDLVMTFKCKKA